MLPNLDCKLFKVKIQEIAWRSMHRKHAWGFGAQGKLASSTCAVGNAHPKPIEGKRALQRIHCIIKHGAKLGLCNKLFRTMIMSVTKSGKGADVQLFHFTGSRRKVQRL